MHRLHDPIQHGCHRRPVALNVKSTVELEPRAKRNKQRRRGTIRWFLISLSMMERLYSNKPPCIPNTNLSEFTLNTCSKSGEPFLITGKGWNFIICGFSHTCAIGQNTVSKIQNRSYFMPCMLKRPITNRTWVWKGCVLSSAFALRISAPEPEPNLLCWHEARVLVWGSWQTGSVPLMKSSCSNTAGVSRAGVDVVQNEMIWIKPPDLFLC